MTENYLSMMAESLDKKISLLKRIEAENKKQKDLLEQPETLTLDEFDLTVDAKGKLIEEIDFLNDGLSALYEKVRVEIGDNKDRYRDYIRDMQEKIREINDLSAAIQAGESKNKMLADNYFKLSRDKLKESRRSNNTAFAYYQNMSRMENVSPQFYDHKN